MLVDYWKTESLKLLYTGDIHFWKLIWQLSLDTDSIFIAVSLPLEQMIQPEKADYYWKNVHPVWFYDPEKDPIEKMRKPGIYIVFEK